MTEIKITGIDTEWATAIRAALIRAEPSMLGYPVDIVPPIIAQIRHQARTEALEEAAKVMDRRKEMYREKAAKRDISAPDTMNAHDGSVLCGEASEYGATAIRALSRSGGE